MPAAASTAKPSSPSDFAALLGAPENPPPANSPATSWQSGAESSGGGPKITASRPDAKVNGRTTQRRQESPPQSAAGADVVNPATATPTPGLTAALHGAVPATQDTQAAASTSAKTASAPAASDFTGLLIDAASGAPVTADLQAAASTESKEAELQNQEQALPPASTVNAVAGLAANPFAATTPEVGKQTAKPNPAATAQFQKPADKAAETRLNSAKTAMPTAAMQDSGSTQDQAAKAVVASAVKTAVSQATLQSNKEIQSKAVAGHSLEGKSAAASSPTADFHASKNSGNESSAGGNGRDAASGQNETKKFNESDTAKSAEFAHLGSGQNQPVAAHDSTEVTTRVSPEQGPLSAGAKETPGSGDSASTPASSHASALPGTPDDALQPGSLVHSTTLLEQLGRTELKVGMRMGDFGNVEIRTQMHDQQLKAEISVEHRDLGRILTNELPALQEKLQQNHVPLASLVVRDHGTANGGSGFQGDSRGQQQLGFTPQTTGISVEHAGTILSPEEVREGTSALDVRI